MPEDPDSDPVTGVLYNKLGLGTAAGLEAAEREITHAALILLRQPIPVKTHAKERRPCGSTVKIRYFGGNAARGRRVFWRPAAPEHWPDSRPPNGDPGNPGQGPRS